jgi:hypothetical protein
MKQIHNPQQIVLNKFITKKLGCNAAWFVFKAAG